MGEEADYLIEQMELEAISNGEWGVGSEFPYGFHVCGRTHITKSQMVELAKQAAHDGNIVERAMRNMTLDQVLRIKNDKAT